MIRLAYEFITALVALFVVPVAVLFIATALGIN
jgi:hypothetical protein